MQKHTESSVLKGLHNHKAAAQAVVPVVSIQFAVVMFNE